MATMRPAAYGLWLACLLGATPSALAADASEPAPAPSSTSAPLAPPALSPPRRAASVAAAVVPGALVHGSGHFVAKQPKTGRRLLLVGSSGLVVAAGSLVAIAMTGASRQTITPLAGGMVMGLGAFALTWLADLYGVAMPASWRGRPLTQQPWLVTESGVYYRYDQQFPGRALSHHAVRLLLRQRHELHLELDAIPGDPSSRSRAMYGVRLWNGEGDNSHLVLEAGGLHQRFAEAGFNTTTFEAALRGRYDLQRVGPSLRGAFVEGRLGAGRSILSYRADRDYAGATDTDQLLLLRWGFGTYFGRGRGEAQIAYEHRGDTYAGRFLVSNGRSGYLGFFAGRTSWYFSEHFGLQADLQVGAAWMSGLSVLFREGAR